MGTGGGFPGLPLAIVNPRRQFVLIDAVAKKLRFVEHACSMLGLATCATLHARVEQAARGAGPFDTVIARAFAPLPRLAAAASRRCAMRTRASSR